MHQGVKNLLSEPLAEVALKNAAEHKQIKSAAAKTTGGKKREERGNRTESDAVHLGEGQGWCCDATPVSVPRSPAERNAADR